MDNITSSQVFADINTGALTEVEAAACRYYDSVRGLTARQQFFIYPDGSVVSLTSVDGGSSAINLSGDDLATFQHRHPAFFN